MSQITSTWPPLTIPTYTSAVELSAPAASPTHRILGHAKLVCLQHELVLRQPCVLPLPASQHQTRSQLPKRPPRPPPVLVRRVPPCDGMAWHGMAWHGMRRWIDHCRDEPLRKSGGTALSANNLKGLAEPFVSAIKSC